MRSIPADDVRDEEIAGALRAVEAGVAVLGAGRLDALSNRDRMAVLGRLEKVGRMIPSVGHRLINQLTEQGAAEELGAADVRELLMSGLRIRPSDAGSRVRTAWELGPRATLSGGTLAPTYEHTAAAQRDGEISCDHVAVIQRFFRHLPRTIDNGTWAQSEENLASAARTLRPDELAKVAERLLGYLDPDGEAIDERDRARRRSFRMGPQGRDRMTKGSFVADPELRAYLEAVFAKYAKPGVCNPQDVTPTVDDEPVEEAVTRDGRTAEQRQHDAMKAVCRAMLASGELGRHRGLPVTAVVTMDVKDVENASGVAMTGGGSLIPMKDALRMSRHAHHYLAIFDDDGRPLYLGRSKRIASGDQRIVLHASDRGCTYPACVRSGYLCQAHHADTDWADGGLTDADQLTFACELHHPLAGPKDTDWHTVIAGPEDRYPGRTYWVPPAHVDPERRPRVNHYHRPGEYLLPADDESRKPGEAA